MWEDAEIFHFQPAPRQLDVLLMVDNSLGMADKQGKLSTALRVLMERFTRPVCVDAAGVPTGARSDGNRCASGAPEFPPLTDIHVGVITSSLGDHGSNDVCSDTQNQANLSTGSAASQYNDRAQLLPSVRVDTGDTDFLSWNGGDDNDLDSFALQTNVQIIAAGARGCGYEAQLESWYRFLIDPEPIGEVSSDGAVGTRGPVNRVVLDQRAAFLRPGSAVAIVMLTDENDCSIIDEDQTQAWLVGFKGGVGAINWHMPRSTSSCANPNDACCRPCTANPAPGCPENDGDSACSQGQSLPLNEDSMNLRCFAQVKRFGIDFLYPTSRYVQGLLSRAIAPRFGGADVENPLYAGGRDPSDVYLAGIVGVPWQDISTEDSWSGSDLKFMTAAELERNGRWDVILGEPELGIPPTDPFMLESIDPRPSGAPHPLIPTAIVGPADGGFNPINGWEFVANASRDELQFACTYDLSFPRSPAECDADPDACPCNADEYGYQSPLCEGGSPEDTATQIRDKAYPSLRELEVLRAAGSRAVVASVCPKNVEVPNGDALDASLDYNPAAHALADRMTESFAGDCLPFEVSLDAFDQMRCTVIEARPSSDCTCDPAEGRREATDGTVTETIQTYLNDSGLGSHAACLCELPQLTAAAGAACRAGDPAITEPGFCYIDGNRGIGDPALVGSCPDGQKRRVRYVGANLPAGNAKVFLSCNYG
jgi:hypothetical protein